MHEFLFYNKFIICLYMFRALFCSSSDGQIVLYSIWNRHTETSERSKITKTIRAFSRSIAQIIIEI